MSKDQIGYDKLMDHVLRDLIKSVLLKVASDGLRGEHHLYITFLTAYPGVIVPDYFLENYPDECTIVIQHQFWGLEVEEDQFSVILSFNKNRETIVVPYNAITQFSDPSVKFGLQLTPPKTNNPPTSVTEFVHEFPVIPEEQLDKQGENLIIKGPKEEITPLSDETELGNEKEIDKDNSERVVSLDAFRKK